MNCEKVKQQIVKWLKDYSEQSNTSGFVVGVSGGVDSGLVSTLCAKTGIHTIILQMPINRIIGPISDRSQKHCDWLLGNYTNVSLYNHDLSKAFQSVIDSAPIHHSDLSKANLRSRLRMCALYLMSNTNNLLVVGTGNAVEDVGVGFCTRYGDSAVDISPIGDLMKSEVRELAKYLGVSDDIVNATPTDELWDDARSDEDQIGATYDELEWAMKHLRSTDEADTMLSIRQKEVLKIYIDRHNKNAHKMQMPPVCIIGER